MGSIMTDFRIAQPDDEADISYKVLASIEEAFDFYQDQATYESSVSGATKGQLAVFACRWYVYEVENGGHHQFFSNSTGMVWQDALDGFGTLRETALEEVLRAAVSLFPNQQPSQVRQKRQEQLENIDRASFNEMDDRLYDALEKHDLDASFEKYIGAHPEEFFVDP
jgi:hypothetical protein